MPGHAKVTSSMCAIASYCAITKNIDCGLLQAHFNNDPLINQFFSNVDSEVAAYLSNSGVDSLMRNVKSGSLAEESIRGCTFSFSNGKLNLFAGTNSRNKTVFENDMLPILPACVKAMDATFDISFIDAPSGAGPLAVEAIRSADLVVVCLPQNYNILDYLFKNYELPKGKVFYLFGDYDSRQVCNIKNVVRRYRGKISLNSVGCIPHSTEYADALNTGKLISFFYKNSKCQKSDSNYEFIESVSSTAERLIKCSNNIGVGGRLC